MLHAFALQPFGQFPRDIAGAIVTQPAQLVNDAHYSTTLIFVMLAAVGLLQLMVGKTRIGRRMDHKSGG